MTARKQPTPAPAGSVKPPPPPAPPQADALREAIDKVLEGFDKGLFVRNTFGDSDPSWAVKLAPYLVALGVLAASRGEGDKG